MTLSTAHFFELQGFSPPIQNSNRIGRDGSTATVERSFYLGYGSPTLDRTVRAADQTERLSPVSIDALARAPRRAGEREFPISIESYGHSEHTHSEETVRVPRFEVACDDRKGVVAVSSRVAYHQKRTDGADERARERLKEMGYLWT